MHSHSHPETEERQSTALSLFTDDSYHLPWEPKFPAKFNGYPPAWRELIVAAKHSQKALGISDNKFAGSIIAGSAWNQLFNGAYRMPTTEAGVQSICNSLRDLMKRGELLLRDRAEETRQEEARSIAERYVPRDELTDVHDALREASARLRVGNEERNIVVIGETRSGKSWMIEKLLSEQKVQWRFRARPASKGRYRAFLKGIAKALNMRDIDKRDIDDLEEAILDKLNENPCAIAIEELQRFSKRALEFLKCVMNETKATLLLFLKPREYKRMVNADDEDAEQFLGRTVVKVELHVTAALVKAMAKQAWQTPCPEAVAKLIAEAAAKGGALSLVREVLTNAVTFAGGASRVERQHVESALEAYRRGVPELHTARKLFGLTKTEKHDLAAA